MIPKKCGPFPPVSSRYLTEADSQTEVEDGRLVYSADRSRGRQFSTFVAGGGTVVGLACTSSNLKSRSFRQEPELSSRKAFPS